MDSSLEQALEESLGSAITDSRRVHGGSINRGFQVFTSRDAQYFVKYHHAPPEGFFEQEAAGLSELASTNTVRVPEVIAYGSTASRAAFLILEWIDASGSQSKAGQVLGRDLAALHQIKQSAYGREDDNYIGSLSQPNGWRDRWATFYVENRLAPQAALAEKQGFLPEKRRKRLEALMARFNEYIDETAIHPAPLHGDLWGGNWLANADSPALIDPAFYYGDREVDLAMTHLFGGFPPSFYSTYNEVYPLLDGHEDRISLYQLYYLLVHLNLFGKSYAGQVDTILKRYVD